MYETVVANLAGRTRRATLQGREYLVAPLTLIVPGVLNGSKGPLLYPPDEVARNVGAWNGIPILVNHPSANGQHISGRDPEVMEKQGIGFVYRDAFDGKRRAEGWFDVEALKRVDNRILDRLQAGKPIELSTGLFTENVPAEDGATHNGRTYAAVARGYVPDHLAILPDERGACSLADGCGVLVNRQCEACGQRPDSSGATGTSATNTQPSEEATMNREATIQWLTANCDCWKGKDKVLANADAFSDADLDKLKARAEKAKADEVVANTARTTLGIPDAMAANEMPAFIKEKMMKDEDEEEDDEEKKKKPAENQAAKPVGLKEWEASMPAEAKAVWNAAKRVEQREREALLTKLVGHLDGDEKKAVFNTLKAKPLDELQTLLALCKPVANQEADDDLPVYLGAAGGTPALAANRDDSDNLLPTFNYDFTEMASPKLRRTA